MQFIHTNKMEYIKSTGIMVKLYSWGKGEYLPSPWQFGLGALIPSHFMDNISATQTRLKIPLLHPSLSKWKSNFSWFGNQSYALCVTHTYLHLSHVNWLSRFLLQHVFNITTDTYICKWFSNWYFKYCTFNTNPRSPPIIGNYL